MKNLISSITLIVVFSFTLFAQEEEPFGVTLNAGFAFPLGDYGKIYNAGLSTEFVFSYDLEWNTNFYAVLGYTRWTLDNEAFNKNYSGSGKFDIKAPISAMPVLVGIRWFWEHEKYAPYVLIEGGIYNYSREVSGTYLENGIVSPIRPKDDTFRETTFNFGIGGIWRLNEDIDLDVKARYHLVSDSNTYNYGDTGYDYRVSTSKFISVLAGVQFKF